MEHRLVLNNLSESDIPNNVLSGQLHQQLKYYKFRRVPSKTGKDIFYLFFHNEKDTYFALREAKLIKGISLVRYRHRNPVPAPLRHLDDIATSEACYYPQPPRNIINLIRYNSVEFTDRFSNKV